MCYKFMVTVDAEKMLQTHGFLAKCGTNGGHIAFQHSNTEAAAWPFPPSLRWWRAQELGGQSGEGPKSSGQSPVQRTTGSFAGNIMDTRKSNHGSFLKVKPIQGLESLEAAKLHIHSWSILKLYVSIVLNLLINRAPVEQISAVTSIYHCIPWLLFT